MTTKLEQRLAEIRGAAKQSSPNVRALAAYAQHAGCKLATVGFVACVSFDHLLAKTRFQMPFGQSPFAIGRGFAFEKMLRANDYAATRDLFRALPGFPAAGARITNLRNGYPKDKDGMARRAADTISLLRQIANNDPRAAHLIDGAVLTTTIAGRSAYFEADALATWSASRIHAAEVKSFPKVDDRVDPDKFGAAMDQVAIYILLARDAIAALGADSERLVSDKALLVTPKNVGLTPTLSEHAVGRRIERNRKVLNSIPIPDEVIAGVPTKLSFDRVADTQVEERVRLDVLNDIADRVGTCYEPTCLSTCGNARFCRERTFRFGAPMISGSAAVRLLPEVSTFHRVDELAQGALPSEPEAPAAVILERARRLYTEAASQGTATPLDATERKTA